MELTIHYGIKNSEETISFVLKEIERCIDYVVNPGKEARETIVTIFGPLLLRVQ